MRWPVSRNCHPPCWRFCRHERRLGVQNLASGGQGTQRPGLVLAHQARVASHVGGEDRRELPFDSLFLLGLHRFPPPSQQIVRRKEPGFKDSMAAYLSLYQRIGAASLLSGLLR